MSRIEGDALIGFGDFFEESVGAAPARGPARGPAKPGVKPVSIKSTKTSSVKAPPAKIRAYAQQKHAPGTSVVERHGQVLAKAHGTAAKAAATVAKAKKLLAATVKAPAKKPVVIGVDVNPKKVTPKAQAAISKHNAAVEKANKATQVLAQQTIKAKAALTDLAKKMVAQKKLAIALRKPKTGRTAVGAVYDAYYDLIGADPDPANPGFLTDGSPDPAATASDPSADPTASLTDTPAGDAIDSGAQLPAPPSMDTFIPDMQAVGGIAYNGAKGTPDGFCLSYGLATRATDVSCEPDSAQIEGTAHFGYVWGKYDKLGPEKGIGWGSHLAPNAWNHVHGRFWLGNDEWHDTASLAEAAASSSKTVDTTLPGARVGGYLAGQPKQTTYGPLVGNPVFKDFAAMRVDGAGNMFWLPQEAPDWLTFPLKQAAALTAQAEAKAAAEQAKADAAAQAKAQADAAAAQAQQDAANALAESQAASDAKVQQMKSEADAQQALVQQAQAEAQQTATDAQQEKEANDLLLAQARRADAYYQQHPEEEFAPQAADDGGDAGDGGDDGGGSAEDTGYPDDTMPDGSPVPGADMMQDADGEGFQDDEGDGSDEG